MEVSDIYIEEILNTDYFSLENQLSSLSEKALPYMLGISETGRTSETTVWYRSTALLMSLIRLGVGLVVVAIPASLYYPYQIIVNEIAPKIIAIWNVASRLGLLNEGPLFDKIA